MTLSGLIIPLSVLDHLVSQHALATLVDFRKAFDCVQHRVLLNKLNGCGIGSIMLDWIKSYLTNRKQKVLANGIYSSDLRVTQGVPQGLMLGSLFYIVYANDLVNVLDHCKVALYADDTVIYTSSTIFRKYVSRVQTDINSLSDWSSQNGIRANPDNTKVMVFGSANCLNKVPNFEIRCDGIPLQIVNSYEYLVVTIDNQLNYNLHVNKLVASVSSKLELFQCMHSFLSVPAAILVYKSMLLPVLQYGDILLSATTRANSKKLQTLQNKGLRCALNKGLQANTSELHTEAKLLPLNYRRELHLMNFMYDWAIQADKLKDHSKPRYCTCSLNKRLL